MFLIKVLFIKNNVVLKFCKNEEITLPHEFIFVFIQHLVGSILLEKYCQKRGVWKIYKMEGMAI